MATGEKAPGAFRTIGELSQELGVAQHILRYWETKFPQLRPLQRAGNRRYYRPADVELARRIHRLLNEEGYTVRGVQKLLRDKDAPSRRGGDRGHEPAIARPRHRTRASEPRRRRVPADRAAQPPRRRARTLIEARSGRISVDKLAAAGLHVGSSASTGSSISPAPRSEICRRLAARKPARRRASVRATSRSRPGLWPTISSRLDIVRRRRGRDRSSRPLGAR